MSTHKIIKTQNYLLVVDEIAPIEAYKTPAWNEVAGMLIKHSKVDDFFCSVSISKESPLVNGINVFEGIHKIISHLPLNNSPVLVGVDLLPTIDQDATEKEKCEEWLKKEYPDESFKWRGNILDAYWTGYKAATKTYSEGNLQGLIQVLLEAHTIGTTVFMKRKADEYIQSLNKAKLPVGFEAETIGANKIGEDTLTVKTIPNEQGIPVWQGTYLY